ncbi:MAG: hypothetical protein QOE37_2339, partial [Microbacteriaceae bacterium]|nr:hypothetical protein [Microbacteriaceae bacterium]
MEEGSPGSLVVTIDGAVCSNIVFHS